MEKQYGDNEDMVMMKMERYYIKTRDVTLTQDRANLYGIKRVYNSCSDIDFMNKDDIGGWISGLYSKDANEAVLVESALKVIDGVPVYVSTCIVFHSAEMCNVYFIKNSKTYSQTDGFFHLLN